ncbi:translation initiation factor EIF-2B alpha subunit [Cryptosporidium ubiquitum]|uniref:Translation initiation factor EIF-2B alpha subunit n=1 Tax=Cryptosporidium ubiquitum TaxID=857276 RepID=A0A1J4MNM3_9CRYT|nr:translation initiation factor EIF-2B alpha subunit [Cryptosporidium ubiquitum]OII74628.1 translation initiation factor EIF-2B alpha subunit [Cryptosporidium ubiquitum]
MALTTIRKSDHHYCSNENNKAGLFFETGRNNVDKVVEYFWGYLESELSVERNSGVYILLKSALFSLSKVVSESLAINSPELITEITAAREILMLSLSNEKVLYRLVSEYGTTNISIAPICRIFESKILRLLFESCDSDESQVVFLKGIITEKTNNFVNKIVFGIQKMVNLSLSIFVKDRMTILTFGYSEIVEMVLENAWINFDKHYNLLVVIPSEAKQANIESSVRNGLYSYHYKKVNEWKNRLINKGVSITILSMDTIYNAMNIVDFVLLNVECVLENGSAIAISGTATISSIAKRIFNKPVYIVTHATKFTNLLPFNMNINNILSDITYQNHQLNSSPITSIVDISENSYISMIFTDIGAMTPQNVSLETRQFI